MAYGGPYLGLLACREQFVRKMPGRLVGQTVDRNGKRCWVLTLQTREQHIRREKATSNICTNQGLFALRAAVYLAALGPQGLKETAELCLRKAHYAAEQLAQVAGVRLRFDRPFFKEFTLQVPGDGAGAARRRCCTTGYHAGLHLGRWYPDAGRLPQRRGHGEAHAGRDRRPGRRRLRALARLATRLASVACSDSLTADPRSSRPRLDDGANRESWTRTNRPTCCSR